MSNMADGLGFQPRVKEPETSGEHNAGAQPLAGGPQPFLAPNIPDTSAPGPTPLQEPAAWTYDFNPASGSSRAFFNGEVSANSISGGAAAGVTSWNGETGVVVMQLADIENAGGAPIASPVFTGNPAAPTRLAGDSSGGLATTAFVQQAITANAGVTLFNGRSGAITLTTGDVTGAGGAPANNAALTGTPTAPTATPGDTSSRIATDAFVAAAIAGQTVTSFNGRQGAVALSLSDVMSVGGAPVASPTFTGSPVVPTAAPGTATGQAASTAFVTNAVSGAVVGVASFNTRTGAVVLTPTDLASVGGAPLASPTFTGSPHAPTPSAGDNSTLIATTAFVDTAIGSLPAGVSTFNGRTGTVVLTLPDVTSVGGAPVASPTFTGSPITTTPTPGDNSTRIASTAFVAAAVPAASAAAPLINGTAAPGSSALYSRGDHVHPTDTTRYAASNPSGFQTAAQVTASLAPYAPLAGATFSGTVSAPGVVSNLTYFSNPQASFYAQSSGNQRAIAWRGGVYGLNFDDSVGQLNFVGNAAICAYLQFDGTFTVATHGVQPGGGPWIATSDERIKTVQSDYSAGLDEVLQLRPVAFTYNGNDTPTADPTPTLIQDDGTARAAAHSGPAPYPSSPHYQPAIEGREFIGLVAQEVEAIFPEMVTQREGFIDGEPVSDMRNLDAGPLIYALVNAVKTLAARVEALEAA